MEDATRSELRVAAAVTAGCYVPAVMAWRALAEGTSTGGPWLPALALCAAVGYLLVIDVLLPLRRSKVRMGMDLAAWTVRTLHDNDAWYLRVLVILAVVVATQIAVDLIPHH